MEELGKNKRPYHGIAIPFIVMICVPVGMYFFFYWVIDTYFDHPKDITISIALGGACLVGFLFDCLGIGRGFLTDLFAAFIERIKDFKAYYGKITKESLAWYFHQFMEDGGIIFWALMLLMLITAAISVGCFVYFFRWYSSIR